MRRYFFLGLAVGVPAGMLVADLLAARSRRQWEARAREWIAVGRERASQMADRAVRGAQEKIREIPGNAGRNLSELFDPVHERLANQPAAHAGSALNLVSREELLAVYGIGPVLADRILRDRPYASDLDVVERGILNETAFDQLRRQLLERYRRSA